MLKLLLLAPCPFPAPRGSQVFIGGSARGLREAGHDVTVACYAGGASQVDVPVIRGTRVPGEYSGSGPHPSKALANVALARAVRRWARAHRPDVVFAHNVEGPLVARLAGIGVPVVWEVHTQMAVELPTFIPGTGPLGAGADRIAAALSDHAVALSEQGASWLRPLGLGVSVIPPGVCPAELAQADRARGRARYALDDRPWVVYAGNADGYQEIGRLLRAVQRIPEVGLLLVGGGMMRLDVSGLPAERVRCLETDRVSEHFDALAAGDLAVIPRRQCAGFPMKLLNHAALGLPTVAAGDSAQPIPGTIAAGSSIESLAEAISMLAGDPTYRQELGDRARNAAMEQTWRARGERLADVAETMLRSAARR